MFFTYLCFMVLHFLHFYAVYILLHFTPFDVFKCIFKTKCIYSKLRAQGLSTQVWTVMLIIFFISFVFLFYIYIFILDCLFEMVNYFFIYLVLLFMSFIFFAFLYIFHISYFYFILYFIFLRLTNHQGVFTFFSSCLSYFFLEMVFTVRF